MLTRISGSAVTTFVEPEIVVSHSLRDRVLSACAYRSLRGIPSCQSRYIPGLYALVPCPVSRKFPSAIHHPRPRLEDDLTQQMRKVFYGQRSAINASVSRLAMLD